MSIEHTSIKHTVVEIISVKCISPSSGLDDAGQFAAELTGTVVGSIAGVGIAVVSGGSGSAAIPLGALLGSATGVVAANLLDEYVTGDADDLYIKVDGKKVWPKDDDSESIESQQTKSVGITELANTDQRISLCEWDHFGDDDLGGYTVKYGQEPGYYGVMIKSDSEPASLYQLCILVWSVPYKTGISAKSTIQLVKDLKEGREKVLLENQNNLEEFGLWPST